jgi:hypothetical protein
MKKKAKSTKLAGKINPVKKNMDKFTRPSTHLDKKKEAKKNGEFYL